MENNNYEGLLILMADGNLRDHEVVKSAARACNINHVFTSVYNGAQLLDYLYQRGAYYSSGRMLPSVLIMDIRLDRVEGFEALETIKKDKKLKSIPVFVLTNTKNEEEAAKAMDLGVKGFFQKPLSDEEWSRIVHNICDISFAEPRK